MSHGIWISDISCPSPTSSESSFDEDEVNYRVKPYWSQYRSILKHRGFHLETVRDVQDYYTFIGMPKRAERLKELEEDILYPDAGLVSLVPMFDFEFSSRYAISQTTSFEASE